VVVVGERRRSSTKGLTIRSNAVTLNHMVEDLAQMDAVFHALAHTARREMLGRLARGELTVGELAEPMAMSLAAASKHIKVLEHAGLVDKTVDGRRHVCRLDALPLAAAAAWLAFYEAHWRERLDALETLFAEAEAEAEAETNPKGKAKVKQQTPARRSDDT
jgi:DNA-binding transcriptional ArsR family regulator